MLKNGKSITMDLKSKDEFHKLGNKGGILLRIYSNGQVEYENPNYSVYLSTIRNSKLQELLS